VRRRHPREEEKSLQPEQTVAEMANEVLTRQAEAEADRSGRPLKEAFEDVLKTEAGRQLVELADGPHRHEKAAEWQAGLVRERAAERALEGVPT
jgi:hypothetical protein